MTSDRYQHQSLWVQRYRDLWLLVVPYDAVFWWLSKTFNHDRIHTSFSTCWSIARGYCDARRNKYLTWDEVKTRRGELLSQGDEEVTMLDISVDF